MKPGRPLHHLVRELPDGSQSGLFSALSGHVYSSEFALRAEACPDLRYRLSKMTPLHAAFDLTVEIIPPKRAVDLF